MRARKAHGSAIARTYPRTEATSCSARACLPPIQHTPHWTCPVHVCGLSSRPLRGDTLAHIPRRAARDTRSETRPPKGGDSRPLSGLAWWPCLGWSSVPRRCTAATLPGSAPPPGVTGQARTTPAPPRPMIADSPRYCPVTPGSMLLRPLGGIFPGSLRPEWRYATSRGSRNF
eukprot:gene9109-biopygen18184